MKVPYLHPKVDGKISEYPAVCRVEAGIPLNGAAEAKLLFFRPLCGIVAFHKIVLRFYYIPWATDLPSSRDGLEVRHGLCYFNGLA